MLTSSCLLLVVFVFVFSFTPFESFLACFAPLLFCLVWVIPFCPSLLWLNPFHPLILSGLVYALSSFRVWFTHTRGKSLIQYLGGLASQQVTQPLKAMATATPTVQNPFSVGGKSAIVTGAGSGMGMVSFFLFFFSACTYYSPLQPLSLCLLIVPLKRLR